MTALTKLTDNLNRRFFYKILVIDPAIRKQVIAQWLSGHSRDTIAADNGIGQGTASNIISKFKKGVQDCDISCIRELAVNYKKEGINLGDLTSVLRIKNHIKQLGLNEERAEELLARCANLSDRDQDPQKLIDILEKMGPLDVPLKELEERIKTARTENDALEARKLQLQTEIEERRKTLDTERLQLQREIEEGRRMLDTINVDKEAAEHLKAELKKYGLDINSLDSKRFIDTLQVFRRFNFDYNKMVETFVEVEDVVVEKRNIERLKLEVENNQHALDTVLSIMGLANIEQLKQVVISLMTFETFGISQEQIIGLARNANLGHLNTKRRQQWERSREWGNWVEGNNGGGGYHASYPY